jgi:transcriptional regulator with XRE-family HTH domain
VPKVAQEEARMDKVAKKSPGPAFRRARRVRGLSIEDVARLADLSVTTVSDVERGLRSPKSESKLRAVFAALGEAVNP